MDMSDHILQSVFLIRDWFKDDDKAVEWFKKPNSKLGNGKPIDLLVLRPAKLYDFIKSQIEKEKI